MGTNSEKRILLDKLNHEGAAFRVQGIIDAAQAGTTDIDVINHIIELKNDNIDIMARPVSQYAIAALDILGVESYKGDNQDTKEFIKYMLTW